MGSVFFTADRCQWLGLCMINICFPLMPCVTWVYIFIKATLHLITDTQTENWQEFIDNSGGLQTQSIPPIAQGTVLCYASVGCSEECRHEMPLYGQNLPVNGNHSNGCGFPISDSIPTNTFKPALNQLSHTTDNGLMKSLGIFLRLQCITDSFVLQLNRNRLF